MGLASTLDETPRGDSGPAKIEIFRMLGSPDSVGKVRPPSTSSNRASQGQLTTTRTMFSPLEVPRSATPAASTLQPYNTFVACSLCQGVTLGLRIHPTQSIRKQEPIPLASDDRPLAPHLTEILYPSLPAAFA